MSLPPSGEIPQGAIRFNTDSQKLEFYAQGEWWIMSTDTPNLAQSGDSTPGARGIIGARATPGLIDEIDYFTIASRGNATVFGEMSTARYIYGTFASTTRGAFTGGNGQTDRIESITFASTGDAIVDAGTLSTGRYLTIGCSNSIRGIWASNIPFLCSSQEASVGTLLAI